MKDAAQEQKQRLSSNSKQFTLVSVVALIPFVLYFGNMHFQMRSSREALNVANQEHVARKVFSVADMVSKKVSKEIDCVGGKDLEITCKTIDGEAHVMTFRTKVAAPDFRMRAVRTIDGVKNPVSIREVSGFPLPGNYDEVEGFIAAFSNLNSVS